MSRKSVITVEWFDFDSLWATYGCRNSLHDVCACTYSFNGGRHSEIIQSLITSGNAFKWVPTHLKRRKKNHN